MMCDFKRHKERVGLKIHTENTKIPSNQNSNTREKWRFKNIKSHSIVQTKRKYKKKTQKRKDGN